MPHGCSSSGGSTPCQCGLSQAPLCQKELSPHSWNTLKATAESAIPQRLLAPTAKIVRVGRAALLSPGDLWAVRGLHERDREMQWTEGLALPAAGAQAERRGSLLPGVACGGRASSQELRTGSGLWASVEDRWANMGSAEHNHEKLL